MAGHVIHGTDTAVVKIGLTDKRVPFVDDSLVELKPGQRVVFTGPRDFQIDFPHDSPFVTPTGLPERQLTTKTAVICREVSHRIFDKIDPTKEKINYKYDVNVEGVVLDPELSIVRPQ